MKKQATEIIRLMKKAGHKHILSFVTVKPPTSGGGYIALIALLLSTPAIANYATWYGNQFNGRLTASGERFNQRAMTCASNRYKLGTQLKVTNTANGKSVVCRVNDRGKLGRGVVVDLSKGAFAKIAPLSQGKVKVTVK